MKSSKKSILENFVSLTSLKFVDLGIPLILLPFLVKSVGFENYGKYAFAYSLIFYFLNVTQYGFSLSAVRDIAKERENKLRVQEIFNNVITTQLFLLTIVFFTIALVVLIFPRFHEDYIVYVFASLMLVGDLLFPTWFFQGMEKMRFITIISVASKIIYAVLTVIFIKQPSDFIYIPLYQSVGYIFGGAVAMYLIFKKFHIKYSPSNFQAIKSQIKGSFSSFLTLFTPTLYANSSLFILGIFGLPQHVAFMEAGNKVTGAFGAMNTILTQVFYPYANRNRDKLKDIKKILLVVGFSLSVLMFFFSGFLIKIWLKSAAVDEIILITRILSPSPFLLSAISAYGVNGLLVNLKDKLYLKVVFFASTVGLISGLILIPKYTFIGAAITVVIARFLSATGSFLFNRKETVT